MRLHYIFLLYALIMLTPSSIGLRVINVNEVIEPHVALINYNGFSNERTYFDMDELPNDVQGPITNDNSISPLASDSEPMQETRKNIRQARAKDCDDPKEKTLKDKIDRLVEQTIQDAERKMDTIAEVKERGKEQAPYKIGFILNMVKKSREVQNELFNVAVKHRDDWKSLEQMKIFELMVHTNVDTTNLVRQMVEIHVQYANLSHNIPYERKRVVLLRRASENAPKDEVITDLEIKKNPYKTPLTGRRWQNEPLKKSLPPNETIPVTTEEKTKIN